MKKTQINMLKFGSRTSSGSSLKLRRSVGSKVMEENPEHLVLIRNRVLFALLREADGYAIELSPRELEKIFDESEVADKKRRVSEMLRGTTTATMRLDTEMRMTLTIHHRKTLNSWWKQSGRPVQISTENIEII